MIFRSLILCLLVSFLAGCNQESPKDTSGTQSTTAAATTEATPSASDNSGTDETSSTKTSASEEKAPKFEAAPTEIVKNPEQSAAAMGEGDSQKASGDYEKAAESYNQAMQLDPTNAEIPYKHAVNYAAWGKGELVYESLAVSADMGYSDVQKVSSQSEFDSYRDNPRFQKIVKRVETNR